MAWSCAPAGLGSQLKALGRAPSRSLLALHPGWSGFSPASPGEGSQPDPFLFSQNSVPGGLGQRLSLWLSAGDGGSQQMEALVVWPRHLEWQRRAAACGVLLLPAPDPTSATGQGKPSAFKGHVTRSGPPREPPCVEVSALVTLIMKSLVSCNRTQERIGPRDHPGNLPTAGSLVLTKIFIEIRSNIFRLEPQGNGIWAQLAWCTPEPSPRLQPHLPLSPVRCS